LDGVDIPLHVDDCEVSVHLSIKTINQSITYQVIS